MTSSYIMGPFINAVAEYLKAEQSATGNIFARGVPRYFIVEKSEWVDDVAQLRQLKTFFLNLVDQSPNIGAGENIFHGERIKNILSENVPDLNMPIDLAPVLMGFAYTDGQGKIQETLAVFSGYPEPLEIRGSLIQAMEAPRSWGSTGNKPNVVPTVQGFLIITGFKVGPEGTVRSDEHKVLTLSNDGADRFVIEDVTSMRDVLWSTSPKLPELEAAFGKAIVLYQTGRPGRIQRRKTRSSELETMPETGSGDDNMPLAVGRNDIPVTDAADPINFPKIIRRGHWANSRINFTDISEEIVANSVIDAVMHSWQVPSVGFISKICDAFGIDQSVLKTRGFNQWHLSVGSDLVVEHKNPKINHNASTLPAEFISRAREILLQDPISSSKISAVAGRARLYKVGISRLGRKFTDLENQLSPSIVEIWTQAACVQGIRALNFKTPRTTFNGEGVMFAGIDINPLQGGQDQNPITPMLITPNIIDYCTIENSTDDATGMGFTLIFGSENPMLRRSTASLSVSNPHRTPRPCTL